MFLLSAYNVRREAVTLHIVGFVNENGCGFKDGEAIFQVEPIIGPQQPNQCEMKIVRQVGHVKVENNHPRFQYTDKDFKESINYHENTGYSALDGGLLLNLITDERFMYQSTKNPAFQFEHILSILGLFSQSATNANQSEPSNAATFKH